MIVSKNHHESKTKIQMIIDTTFNVFSDARGGDPDNTSPTLKRYHKLLWSKPLPNGKTLELVDNKRGAYLYHKSELGEFWLGSDAITHSYKNHYPKQWLINQIPNEVDELFNLGSTIGAYTLFPNNRLNGNTINQARGMFSLIDDRFDLTLECIRLFYLGQKSPLYDTFMRYKSFFELFEDFMGYVNYFLLQDLVDENQQVKFYLPFNEFKSRPTFTSVDDYLRYKNGVVNFVNARNKRIENYSEAYLER